MTTIKQRLVAQNRKQTWLIFQLRDRGVSISPSQLSGILSGVVIGPKADLVLSTADEILTELGG